MQERLARAILDFSSSLTECASFETAADQVFGALRSHLSIDWLGIFSIYRHDTRINVITNSNLSFNWDDHYNRIADHDPLGKQTIASSPGQFLLFQDVYRPDNPDAVFTMEYITRHTDTTNGMVMPLLMSPDYHRLALGLFRSDASDLFGPDEIVVMRHLLPVIVSYARTNLLYHELELKIPVMGNLISANDRYLILDHRLAIVDYPDQTRRCLAEICSLPNLRGLPPVLSGWINTAIAPRGRLESGGPWRLDQPLDSGERLTCRAVLVKSAGNRPCLLIEINPHHCRDDFAPLSRIGLTGRETAILAFLPLGYTNQQIARALGITEITVKKHLKNIGDKLEASGKTEILYAALLRLRAIQQGAL